VDWFCCHRFDSPNVFASLLDAELGGYFRLTSDARARAEDDRVVRAIRPHMLPRVRTESGHQDLGFLALELLSGDDPGLQVGQLGQLVRPAGR
jgi:hypothetical protein